MKMFKMPPFQEVHESETTLSLHQSQRVHKFLLIILHNISRELKMPLLLYGPYGREFFFLLLYDVKIQQTAKQLILKNIPYILYCTQCTPHRLISNVFLEQMELGQE